MHKLSGRLRSFVVADFDPAFLRSEDDLRACEQRWTPRNALSAIILLSLGFWGLILAAFWLA
jgi:hypothetical protein